MLRPYKDWRFPIYKVIFHSDTRLGKLFDVWLIIAILISTGTVILESVPSFDKAYHPYLISLEWIFGMFFTLEYIIRIYIVQNKRDYILSTLGIIDLLSIIPFLLSLAIPNAQYFLVLRVLRIMRIYRVMNMLDYMNDSRYIMSALKSSSRKIYIFLLFIVVIVTIVGSLMYVIEGGINGFDSIPTSIYWAVVTLTTVGFGDITPITPLGKFLSVILMLCGYSIIAVPTGIVTAEMRQRSNKNLQACKRCGHYCAVHARYCEQCGERLIA